MPASYYTPDGNLAVWTGTGYHIIPRVAKGDVGTVTDGPTRATDMGDYAGIDGGQEDYFGILDPGKYGLPQDPNNFMRVWDSDPSQLNYLLKSGEKEGSQIRYSLQGDQYVPELTGTQGWDTNADSSGAVALNVAKVLAAPFAVAGLQGAGLLGGAASPGTMSTYGLLDTSMALPGTQFASGIAAGAAPNMTTYGILDKSMALPGTTFTEGVSGGSSLLNGAKDALSNPSNLATLGKLGGVLAGGLLGQSESGNGAAAPYNPTTPPPMYGGAAPPTFQAQGNTETERQMMQYLPSLFSQGRKGMTNLLGIPPLPPKR